jgi:hypothetical protein
MARAMLKWSLTQLADAAKIGLGTATLFEAGESVGEENVAAMRNAFESEHIRFMTEGALAGGIVRSRLRFVSKEGTNKLSQQR